MNALLLVLLQRDEPDGWMRWIVLAVFFGFPLLARLLRALAVRFGLAPAETPEAAAEDPRTRRRRLAEEQRKSESEGEDLWRRLARGEVAAPPVPVPVPAPTLPAERTSRVPERHFEAEASLEQAASEGSLELEGEPDPLSVMGDVSEPSEAPESSLEEARGDPSPLGAFGAASALERAAVLEAEQNPVARVRFVLGRNDLRRAIVLTEVFGPPVSMRP